jgi:hypothetical protein
MWFDIATMWFPAYESISFGDARPMVSFGEKLPKNRKVEVNLVLELVSSPTPIMSVQSARQHLAKYGFQFSEQEEQQILAEMARAAQAARGEVVTVEGDTATGTTFDARANAELGG